MLTELTWSAPKDFLTLSSALTGFTTADLQGTGLVDIYYNQTLDVIGSRITGILLLKWSAIRTEAGTFDPLDAKFKPRIQKDIFDDPLVGPVARNVLLMWYTGNWYQMPGEWRQNYGASAGDQPHVVSAKAYQEGLMWRAIAAHPPAAKSPGFGSWAEPPKSPYEV
ncbi:MAG TPA: hypothetical protein VHR66_27505 [Gemmataceae bacterium]|jgi:hypothetical protein|nr:hypothetical protein [Gemmataceae bacterium]